MFYQKNKIFAILSAVIITAFLGSTTLAGIGGPPQGGPRGSSNDNLYFSLGNATIFVDSTVDIDSLEVAKIPFIVEWNDYPGSELINMVQIKIYFPKNLLIYEDAIVDQWNGNIGFEEVMYPLGSDSAVLTLRLESGSMVPPEDTITYVNIYFRGKCQSVGNSSNLEFNKSGADSYLSMTGLEGTYWPIDNNWTNGEIDISNYWISYDIEDVTTAYLGDDDILIPVYASNNFRLFGYKHVIEFDTTNLLFEEVVLNDDLLPYGCLSGYCEGTANDNQITVFIMNGMQQVNMWGFTPVLEVDTILYWLKFDVIGQSDNKDMALSFVTAECETYIYNNDPLCSDLSDGIDPEDYDNGLISIPYYEAGYKLDFVEINPNKSTGIDLLRYELSMTNNFPAGDLEGDSGISIVCQVAEYFTWAGAYDFPDDVDFHDDGCELGDDGNKYGSVYQIDGGTTNFRAPSEGSYEHLMTIDIHITNSQFDESYDNRFIAPNPYEWYSVQGELQNYTHVRDVSENVVLYHPDLCGAPRILDIEVNGYEYPMGEFSTTPASGGIFIAQDLFIRNSVLIDTFAVTVSVNNDFCIECINCEAGIDAQGITDSEFRVFTESSFGQLPANGDNYIKIATIIYSIPHPCSGNNQYSASVTLDDDEPLMKSGDDNLYVVVDPHDVNGQCNDGSGGCGNPAIIPAGCHTGNVTKISDESDNEDINIIPDKFQLYSNIPNPFNPETIIKFNIPTPSDVRIDVINVLGQKVITLVDEQKSPGLHEVIWNGTDENGSKVSSGIYLYQLRAGDFVDTKKMLLMK